MKIIVNGFDYYESIEELQNEIYVTFPNGDKKTITPDEVSSLDNYWTVHHSCNYGVCDHWITIRPSEWLKKEFNHIYKVEYKGKTLYRRESVYLRLTDHKVWESEVWNS